MSEEQTTQSVVDEPKVAALPDTEATSARQDDDLDTLLAQFDESKPAPSASAKPEQVDAANDTQVANQTVLDEAKFIRSERFKKDMDTTIKEVRGDLPEDFFDGQFIQAWIDSQAMKDPRLGNAWSDRHKDPQKFKQVVGALGKEFAKKYGKLPDKNATEDREAVTAAVRGASTRAPEGKAPDFSRMTDGEFAKEWEKVSG